MHRRDVTQLLLTGAATLALKPPGAIAQSCASANHARTPAEVAARATIVDSARCPGDWRRYGADPSGQKDSTDAIQSACNANVLAYDATGGNYLISATIVLPTGVTIRGAGVSATTLSCSNGGISMLMATSAAHVVVEGIKFIVTSPSEVAHTGAVEFYKCSYCRCTHCEAVGCNWAGALIYDSDHCTVDHCSFSEFQGEVHDSADICIYNNSTHNRVADNQCFGGNWFGISIQDPYNNTLPANNVVIGNSIGEHKAYGLLVYVPTTGDTFNRLQGNTIANIQGSVLENNSGAGIYVVGAGAGGTVIVENVVRNCCVHTKQRSLAPAGIGINGLSPKAVPVRVNGNKVSEMRAHDGILIVSCKGAVTISENYASLPLGNIAGTPIRIDASSNVSIERNSVSRAPETDGRCIFVYANSVLVSNVLVNQNVCYGGRYPQIEFAAEGSGSIAGAICTDNQCHGISPNNSCVKLTHVPDAHISGNDCTIM